MDRTGVPDSISEYREVFLEICVAEIRGGKAADNGRRVAVGVKCSGKVALVAQHVTDPLAASSVVPLPLRVGGIGDRLARGDRRAFVEGGERPGAIALLAQHVANSSMTYGEVALPRFVAWIGRDEAQANRSPSQNGGNGVS